jgi:hypothetical protein
MDLRKFASIMAVALAMVGCDGGGNPPANGTLFEERDFVCAAGAAQPCETSVPARSDAQRTREEPGDLESETRVYVLNAITIPTASDGAIDGFNLDRRDSGEGIDDAETCNDFQPDFVSAVDPGHIGVDNQFAARVAPLLEGAAMTDLDATILEQINSGSLLLMVEVTDIDSFEYDAEISLQLLLGELPAGTTTPMLDAGGRLAAGQTFTVMQTLGPAVRGDIYDGRLRAATESLTLSLTIMDRPLSRVITRPELRFDISSTGLSNGVIGGSLVVADIIEAIRMIPELMSFVGTAMSVLTMYADLQPSTAMPTTCEAISIGLSFGATTATAAR